jgi:hypothetical protein
MHSCAYLFNPSDGRQQWFSKNVYLIHGLCAAADLNRYEVDE